MFANFWSKLGTLFKKHPDTKNGGLQWPPSLFHKAITSNFILQLLHFTTAFVCFFPFGLSKRSVLSHSGFRHFFTQSARGKGLGMIVVLSEVKFGLK